MKLETKHYKPSDKPPIFLSLKENRSQRAVFFFTEKLTIIFYHHLVSLKTTPTKQLTEGNQGKIMRTQADVV